MVNDTTTLNGALTELGETMADNLVSMGVSDADASQGLTTLANKILDISPSVGGLDLDISIDLSKTLSTVYVHDNVLLSAKVNADYDTNSVDVDGVLQGATVSFYNGQSLLGSSVTGLDGIATLTLSDMSYGSYSVTASFDGSNTDYDSATSSALSFNVEHNYSLSFSASEYHTDSNGDAAVEVTLLDNGSAVSGATIIISDGSSQYSCITNNQGVASYTFSNVVSDLTVTATYSNVSASCTVIVSNVIYAPTLDGSETWYKLNSSYSPTYTTEDGYNVISDACGYLLDGWDNTGNWKLTFDYYYVYNRWGDHGALVTFNNVTARDRNSLQIWGEALFNHQGTGSTTVFNSQTVLVSEQWNTFEIVKNGSSLTITVNDTNTYTVTNTDFSNSSRTVACIGLDKTGTNNTSKIRNIIVESV